MLDAEIRRLERLLAADPDCDDTRARLTAARRRAGLVCEGFPLGPHCDRPRQFGSRLCIECLVAFLNATTPKGGRI